MTWKKLFEMCEKDFTVKKVKTDSKNRLYFITEKDEAFYPPMWLFDEAAEKEGQMTEYFIEQWKPIFKLSFVTSNEGKRLYFLEYRLK